MGNGRFKQEFDASNLHCLMSDKMTFATLLASAHQDRLCFDRMMMPK